MFSLICEAESKQSMQDLPFLNSFCSSDIRASAIIVSLLAIILNKFYIRYLINLCLYIYLGYFYLFFIYWYNNGRPPLFGNDSVDPTNIYKFKKLM